MQLYFRDFIFYSCSMAIIICKKEKKKVGLDIDMSAIMVTSAHPRGWDYFIDVEKTPDIFYSEFK